MKSNVGSTDKIIRILLGIIIAYFAYSTTFETAWVEAVLYIVAALLFITSAFSICPMYSVFRINTCKVKE
jgi:predicted membrane protein